jgi:putative phage-type endonuclease
MHPRVEALLAIPIVEQKTTAWYEQRHSMVTASDFAQALGDGKFGSVKQFYKKKVEAQAVAGGPENPFFKWGNMFEDVALSIYSDQNGGCKINEFGLIPHTNPDYPFFGASPDGITDDGVMVEIKCPRKRKIDGSIPLQYYYQMQGQLDVCGLDRCDYFECQFVQVKPFEFYNFFGQQKQYRGVIVETRVDGKTKYNYHPLKMALSEIKEWAQGFAAECPRLYWYLDESHLKHVHRDSKFVKEKLELLRTVWENVEAYRLDRRRYEEEVLKEITIETQSYEEFQNLNLNGFAFRSTPK